jgi:hypothetical protein
MHARCQRPLTRALKFRFGAYSKRQKKQARLIEMCRGGIDDGNLPAPWSRAVDSIRNNGAGSSSPENQQVFHDRFPCLIGIDLC